MKRLRKLASALLAGAMLFSLSACGQKTASIANDNVSDSGKILVAYYSATDNTKVAAQTIADELNADLFEITPTESYTSNDLN